MGFGIASRSSILCILSVLLIAQDSGARQLAISSGRDIRLNEVSHDLKQLAAESQILTNILQVEVADVEMSNNHVKKDKDDDDDDDDEDHHKKLKGVYEKDDDDEDDHKKKVKKVNDDDDDEHKKKEKQVNKEVDDDDDDDDDDRKKGNQVNKNDDDLRKKGQQADEGHDADEHKKIIGKDVHAHKPSHMDDHNHIDSELNVFFTPSDLKVGKTMPIYFANKSSSSPKFLPREEVDQIPFSSKHLSSLLKFFSFHKHSPQAKAMKYTLKQCEIEPMEGETKFCATSLESLLDFASYLFGSNSQFKVLTTTHLTNSTVLLQNYTISKVKEISVPNVIGCHPMPYPYAVFYCHSQKSDTNLYELLVEGENGAQVEAAAICHMDTSKWDPDHVSFRVLKVEPGTSPVCHFFPPDNLVWMPLPAAM